MPQLVMPHIRYAESYLTALEEFQAEDRNLEWSLTELREDFGVLLRALDGFTRGEAIPSDLVPWTQYWLVEGDEYLGRVNIRHRLSPELMEHGGHIGYEIRPSERRKGYGTLILQLALPIAKQMGIDRALLTIDPENHTSRRIIERCGGVQFGVIDSGSLEPEMKFWIET